VSRAAISDCWNRIGVRGDASCPELARHIHCRNCPIFSAAATELLDAPLSGDDLAQATGHVARAKPVGAASTQSLLVFRIGAEWLALPTAIIREIAGPRPIHALPHRRDGVVLGLANIRGQLLVCAALGRILKLEDSGMPARGVAEARMLVTLQGNAGTVYPVDEVFGVQRFPPHELVAVPGAGTVHVRAVLSWQAKSVSLIDEDLLLSTVNRSLASATAI
jgi:chemotaxis-related protein WspD